MALLRINNTEENILGSVTFERDAVYDEVTGEIKGQVINGLLATHDYIEDLYAIETERYILTGVSVFRESFGSNEYMILYHFNAKGLEIKPDSLLDEDIKWLIEESIIEKEKEEGEWFHGYLQREAYKEVEKLAEKFKAKEADETSED